MTLTRVPEVVPLVLAGFLVTHRLAAAGGTAGRAAALLASSALAVLAAATLAAATVPTALPGVTPLSGGTEIVATSGPWTVLRLLPLVLAVAVVAAVVVRAAVRLAGSTELARGWLWGALAGVAVASLARAATAGPVASPSWIPDPSPVLWMPALGGMAGLLLASSTPRRPLLGRVGRDPVAALLRCAAGAAHLLLWVPPVASAIDVAAAPDLVPDGARGLVVGGGAVVLATALLWAVARRLLPVRHRHRAAVAAAVVAAVATGAVTASWQAVASTRPGALVVAYDPARPGAAVRLPGFRDDSRSDAPPAAPVAGITADGWVLPGDRCSVSEPPAMLHRCTTTTAGAPAKRLVVVGDSHAQQYLAAIEPTARARNWEVVSILRGACPLSTGSDTLPGDPVCTAHNQSALAEIVAIRPDLVVTTATRDVRAGLTEVTPPGFVAAWQVLDGAGIPVLAIRDNPRFPAAPDLCAGAAPPWGCDTARSSFYRDVPPYAAMPGVPGRVSFLDVSHHVCRDQDCPPSIGNVPVYLDGNHMSASYARTLTPVVSAALTASVDR